MIRHELTMFDDDDDPFDDLEQAYADGWLDGNEICGCWCPCERPVESGGDTCDACLAGRHYDPSDPDDRRR